MHGTQRLIGKSSKNFNLFTNKRVGLSVNQSQRVHMNKISIVNLVILNKWRYDIIFVDGNIIGKPARRSVQKYEKNCAITETQQLHMLHN